MTSHEQPTGGHGPLQGLASELDRARRRAGITYPEMASRISNGPSAETLEAAASGSSLPSWAVTRAYTDACGASLSVFLLWNKAREASEASFINRVLELHAKAGPPRTGEKRLRDWGTVSRSTVNSMRKRLQKAGCRVSRRSDRRARVPRPGAPRHR